MNILSNNNSSLSLFLSLFLSLSFSLALFSLHHSLQVSTVQNADMIAVLDSGRIMETGNHDKLMAKKGIYYTLCQQQGGPSPETKADIPVKAVWIR